MADIIISGQTSIHETEPRKKIDTSLYQKDKEEKQRLKDLKKAYKSDMKCTK